MADIGEGPGGPGAPLFWVKKEEMTEGRKVSEVWIRLCLNLKPRIEMHSTRRLL